MVFGRTTLDITHLETCRCFLDMMLHCVEAFVHVQAVMLQNSVRDDS